MIERRGHKRLYPYALLAAFLIPSATFAQQPSDPADGQAQADAQKQLHGKQFRDVHVQIVNGVATLTGQVDRLSDKMDAEKRIARMHETASINNQITVDVPPGANQQELFTKMATHLAYVGQDYDRLAFNSITLRVQDGKVILGGEVVDPVDKDDAVGIVENTPGVRGVVDQLQVAPVSPNDWQLRRALFRAVYGAPQLNKYAIDPAKPIRIVVINGHATLTGMVQDRGDREVAAIRANGVPGVFSVANDLQVQGETPER